MQAASRHLSIDVQRRALDLSALGLCVVPEPEQYTCSFDIVGNWHGHNCCEKCTLLHCFQWECTQCLTTCVSAYHSDTGHAVRGEQL